MPVNTSRGDIIDEVALLEALESGKLAAFGTDVLYDEWHGDMGDSPVVKYARIHDNIIIIQHIGGCTLKSLIDAAFSKETDPDLNLAEVL